jgi:hypothetical protein
MDKLNEYGLPALPRSPRSDDGGHWGLKYGFGGSNRTECPEQVLLLHALRQGERCAIEEAIGYYGYERVAAYWSHIRANMLPYEDMEASTHIERVFFHPGGELSLRTIEVVDALVEEIQLRRLAAAVFPRGVQAVTWWNESSVWLDHQRPTDLVKTSDGRRLLYEYLKRLESGTYT